MSMRRLLVVPLVLTGAAAAQSLPATLAGAAPVALRAGDRGGLDRLAGAEGGTCVAYAAFRYTAETRTMADLGRWLAAQSLTARVVGQDDMVTRWAAQAAQPGGAHVYGLANRADVGSPAGHLWLCAGRSSAELRADEARGRARGARWLLLLGVLAVLGVGGLTRQVSGGVWGS